MTYSYSYLAKDKLMKLSDYPYTGVVGSCKYSAAKGVVNTPSYVNVAKANVGALMAAVA